MPAECSLTSPTDCNPANALMNKVTDAGTSGLAGALKDGAQWVMDTTLGWWVNVPSIDLGATPAQQVQAQVRWLAIAVAVAGVVWQGFRMAVMRKPNPLIDIGRGLITMALWSAIGVIGVQMALRAADEYSAWVLDTATQGQIETKLTGLAKMTEVQSDGAIIVLSLLMIVAGIAQAVLMFFREGAIIVLSGLVVLAAAGSFTAGTRPWLQKWLSWMLALIAYKPVAATVYAVAIQVVGNGRDARTIFIGLTMIVMSLIALPALMKLFNFAVPAAAAGGAGGLAMLGGTTTAAIYAAGMRNIPQSSGSVEQASALSQDLRPGGFGSGPTGPITISGGPGMGPGPISGGPGFPGGPGGAGPGFSPAGADAAAAATGAAPAAAPAAATGAASTTAAGGGIAGAAGPAGAAAAAVQGAAQAGQAAVHSAGSAMSGEGST